MIWHHVTWVFLDDKMKNNNPSQAWRNKRYIFEVEQNSSSEMSTKGY